MPSLLSAIVLGKKQRQNNELAKNNNSRRLLTTRFFADTRGDQRCPRPTKKSQIQRLVRPFVKFQKMKCASNCCSRHNYRHHHQQHLQQQQLLLLLLYGVLLVIEWNNIFFTISVAAAWMNTNHHHHHHHHHHLYQGINNGSFEQWLPQTSNLFSTAPSLGDSVNTKSDDIVSEETNVSTSTTAAATPSPSIIWSLFDNIVRQRYACKRFRRYDNCEYSNSRASPSNPHIVSIAMECLELARQGTPSAFNTQPYCMVMVHTPEQKQALARYCLGPNHQRVLDADCTVVFLADREVCRSLHRFRHFYRTAISQTGRALPWKTQLYIAIFSSGYPIPRVLAAPISFFFRSAMSFLHIFSNWIFSYPLPTLASAETWASKQTTMVAMTYMLACTARELVTIPMEGINVRGIRRALQIPRRFTIPLIVTTGVPYTNNTTTQISSMSDINRSSLQNELYRPKSRRYPMEDAIFNNSYGVPALSPDVLI
jgi:nitroreductase